MRNLAGELPIDYVPPFRERREDQRPLNGPRGLVINFKELESRKQREYDKLERMIKYAQSTKCRRSYILGYFGDKNAAKCGRCDNCGPIEERATTTPSRSIDNEAGQEVLLKVLSGVARARGRFGKVAIAQMLIGSKSEKMVKLGLTQLSTFGILTDFSQSEVTQLIDALAAAELVESTDVERLSVRWLISARRVANTSRAKGTFPLQLPLPDDLHSKVCHGGLRRLTPRPAPKPDVFEIRRKSRDGTDKRGGQSPFLGDLGRPPLRQA